MKFKFTEVGVERRYVYVYYIYIIYTFITLCVCIIGNIFLSTGYKLIVRNLLCARGSRNHTIIVPSCDINLFVSSINYCTRDEDFFVVVVTDRALKVLQYRITGGEFFFYQLRVYASGHNSRNDKCFLPTYNYKMYYAYNITYGICVKCNLTVYPQTSIVVIIKVITV